MAARSMSAPTDAEYIVVGSGAGGGTLAARLAEAGRSVVLLEAGGDPREVTGASRLPEDYDVPVFHPFASENEAMSWSFFVRHYESDGGSGGTRSTGRAGTAAASMGCSIPGRARSAAAPPTTR
jgi:choline dehydrogenase-like flavoprotein